MTWIILVAVIILAIIILNFFAPVGLWITALASGVHVSIFTLIAMRIRKVNPFRIVRPLIKTTKAGIRLPVNALEAHYLAGGDVGAPA